jgi:hypothetical protein
MVTDESGDNAIMTRSSTQQLPHLPDCTEGHSRIVKENQKPGTKKAIWDAPISDQIEGFTTDFSINRGENLTLKINVNPAARGVLQSLWAKFKTIQFLGKSPSRFVKKIAKRLGFSNKHMKYSKAPTSIEEDIPYQVEIYRLGYYGGDGATLVTTITATGRLQPEPITDARGLVDAGNWRVSASWQTPPDAVSGVYLAKLQRLDPKGRPIKRATNQIPFIIREGDSTRKSDILFQTSDTTWQAYNSWGGNNGKSAGNFYWDASGTIDHKPTPDPGLGDKNRAYAVSYNRPFLTRSHAGAHNYLFGAEYSAIYWLEKNGYDVSYISGMDTERLGANNLKGHKAFISVGHAEYW